MLNRCQSGGEMALPSGDSPDIGRCECFLHSAEPSQNFSSTATIVGLATKAWPLLHQRLARELFPLMQSTFSSSLVLRAPMVQEHWCSGRSLLWPVFTGDLGLRASGELLCFCGGARGGCATPENATRLGGFNYSLQQESTSIRTTMLLNGSNGSNASNTSNGSNVSNTSNVSNLSNEPISTSLLHTPSVQSGALVPTASSGKPLEINIVFGILPADASFRLFSRASGPEKPWVFDEVFDATDPWVQRFAMLMCSDLPTSLRSSVLDTSAPGGPWLLAFEQFLLAQGEEYPPRHFDSRLSEFLQVAGAYHKDLLLEGSKLKAMRLSFQLREPEGGWYGDRAGLRAMKAEWDSYLAVRNSERSLKASKVWHTSPAWEILATVEGVQDGSPCRAVSIWQHFDLHHMSSKADNRMQQNPTESNGN
eukprot:TRINITY_DN22355_c0_g1_i2.p1 TRINITY_DN22355_c0_g1~~TRINITY_DN22355_c0_g1_i2.p1  ORF type:complete len:477 (+),score=60.21 TRINITY_DN22355_c0_g1_i2:166-1431(+)